MLRSGLVATLLLLPAVPALAQPDPGREVELDEDKPPPSDDTGREENPDAPRVGEQPVVEGPAAPPPKPTGYPVNEVLRPITLPAFTSETRLDVRVFPSGEFNTDVNLRARYGITRQAQVGVRYLIGGLYDDRPADADEGIKWNTGKTVGVEFQYLIQDWIAPRVAIPMYISPFAIGMQLGPALKFRFGDKLAFVGFEDVVAFQLSDVFVPDLDSERKNELAAIAHEESGTILPDGYLRFDVGAVYQATPDLAITGRFGVTFVDFLDDDVPTALRLQAQFTPRPNLDVIGLIGFEALDQNSSLHLSGAVQVRI